MSTTAERVTYATLAAGQTPEFNRKFDEALARARAGFGARHPHRIGGKEVAGQGEATDTSPIDTRMVLGRLPVATLEDVNRAVEAARAAFPAWSARPYRERTAILRRAADLIEERGFDLSALVSVEVGKSRLEAMGDVTETADLVRYYCEQMDRNEGFDRPMARFSQNEETRSVLRPYGAWVVISPFNFPSALAGGPVGGALVAGNTVVLKPSHEAPLTALGLYRAFADAGLPDGALNLVFGSGEVAGKALMNHPGVDGMLFTGSKTVGMELLHHFSREFPKPCITEMGGKNPAIVMPSADLDAAAEGVMRSAFGLQGQKCSACSRLYVHEDVRARFTELLLDKTAKIVIGDPSQAGVFLGPVIHERAFATYERAAAEARRDGRVLAGARTLREGELAHGFFVAPTVVDELPKDHRLFRDELFVPFVAMASVRSLDEALELANRTEYGLTAGFFSREPSEIDAFLERIQAGVVYVNRRAGATTGAWPGVQPFGGWKASGSSGKASGGLYYVQQFLREQSRTIVR
jgi:1-pyrroline-5-carboxylate dehydrogenase